MKNLLRFSLWAAAAALTLPAQAQFAKPDDAIKYRQSAMFIMAQNVGRIGAMAQGRTPFDAKVAAESAVTAEFMGKLPWPAFADGTDKGSRPHRAKPEVWTNKAKFNEGADKLQMELAKLSAAAKTGSLDAIKAAMGPVGASCKSCHDSFQSSL